MTLGSLFDGAGGFPLSGVLAGITPVWASEVEPFPIRVTTKRFPNMKHLGDISTINGADIEPVDIITFGSPCQDLSVANGNRKGLDGERSGLFRQAIRIIKEMRDATNGIYPTFIVWENVPGAFSSNDGEDFYTVIQQIVGISDEEVSVPKPPKRKSGKKYVLDWQNAGEIIGDGWSIAWRVLDAQYWGVPQRRRRIYLVADFRGQRAGEISFERESLLWHTPQGDGERQGTSGTVVESIEQSNKTPLAAGFHGHKSICFPLLTSKDYNRKEKTMSQKELDRIRKLYTIKFPVGYRYSQARDDVTALLNEIERLKASHEGERITNVTAKT